jgi:hypothetical protein
MRPAALALLAFVVAAPLPSAAQAPATPVTPVIDVELLPWAAYDGVERPYRYLFEIRPMGDRPVDVVADRRLLRFEIRDGRRVHRCVQPGAPSRVSEPRVRTLVPGASGEQGTWREWVDLRMYCVGAARDAMARGLPVQARFGWPRGTRTRWVARRAGESTRQWVAGVEVGSLSVSAPAPRPTRFVDRPEPPPVEIAVASVSARTGRRLALPVSVRARAGSARLFVRPDAWSFRVRGPLGDVRCRASSTGGPPPPELFRRVTSRVALRAVLDADFFCPPGTFDVPGVYEVTPKLSLPYGGEEWGFEAVRGTLSGPTAAVRITHGERGYVEQIPEPASPSPD